MIEFIFGDCIFLSLNSLGNSISCSVITAHCNIIVILISYCIFFRLGDQKKEIANVFLPLLSV